MKFIHGLFWGFVGVVLLSLMAAASAGNDGPQVRVLVSTNVQVPPAVLERARREAARIFRKAGIQLLWVNCSYGTSAGECRIHQEDNLLYLHIVAARTSSSDTVYGQAFLEGGSGTTADLFFDRIEDTQHDFGIDPGRLLGAVAAHEIGHLLLGSHSHLWIGIMTPLWWGDNLRRVSMGDLYFTADQGIRMREHLERMARNEYRVQAESLTVN